VADQIVIGILENSPYVIMPFIVNVTFLLRFFLPVSVFDVIGDVLGVTSTMDHFVGRK